MRLEVAAQTDIGRRKAQNEDFYGVFRADTPGLRLFRAGALLCVADGLGGHLGGEIASKMSVMAMKDIVKETPPPGVNGQLPSLLPLLVRYTRHSNQYVYQANQQRNHDGKPMGTTLISALILPREVHIANVGDSRCYHIREGELVQRTQDHSWVDEQVKLGRMSVSEAELDMRKNIVTRSIGTHPDIPVDTYSWEIQSGDWLLLATDGLVNMVKEREILEEFRAGGSAADITSRLVRLANDNGGKDNITVVLTHISPNIFKLAYFTTKSFVRKQGLKLLWLLVSVLFGAAGFFGGYLFRDSGRLLF